MNIRPLCDRIVVKGVEERESTLHGIVMREDAR